MVVKVHRAPDGTFYIPKNSGPDEPPRPSAKSAFKAPPDDLINTKDWNNVPVDPCAEKHEWYVDSITGTAVKMICRQCGLEETVGRGQAKPTRVMADVPTLCTESQTGRHWWGPTPTSPTGVVCKHCGIEVDEKPVKAPTLPGSRELQESLKTGWK